MEILLLVFDYKAKRTSCRLAPSGCVRYCSEVTNNLPPLVLPHSPSINVGWGGDITFQSFRVRLLRMSHSVSQDETVLLWLFFFSFMSLISSKGFNWYHQIYFFCSIHLLSYLKYICSLPQARFKLSTPNIALSIFSWWWWLRAVALTYSIQLHGILCDCL